MNDVLNLFTEYDVVGAFWVNIKLTFWSAVIATILGVLLIMMRISPISSLRGFAAGYTEFFKNMPLTIIMVFMVLGVFGQLKVSFSDTFAINFFWLSVVGLGVYTAAFVCESLRSGINTVPVGQAEASRASGYPRFRGSVRKYFDCFAQELHCSGCSVCSYRNIEFNEQHD